MMFYTKSAFAFFLLMITITLFREARAAPSCSPVRHSVNETECKYGTHMDWCRNTVCAKGPGQSCGGEWWENGKCGEGTYCACGSCSGCFINLECWFGTFC